jgi:hypothetical protein
MPGPLLHAGATVLCAHGGQATPTAPNPRVTVGGQPTVTMTAPWMVAGCPFATASPQPCVTATFVTAAARVTSMGQPLLLADSQAITAPNGVPLMPVVVQPRVIGQ